MHPRLRLVVLDTYDVGVLGYSDDPNSPHFLQAQHILEKNNPNPEKNSAIGLVGNERRFVAYNGGVGKEQLAWLDTQLTEADAQRQNVLIAGQ
jgi:manganese-dependent ADP-ribose/CDP-alcohol diphosphatase